MHLKYFHDTVLSGHLGVWKTYPKIASNIWCSKMHFEIFSYVHKCDLCQRAKPAQGFRVGLHLASPVTVPMERLFIDFVGPLTRTKRGNIAILVLVDSFSKFVSFCPVRKMTSAAVSDYIGRYYFPTFGVTKSIVSDKAKPFCCKEYKDLFQVGGREFHHHTLLPPGFFRGKSEQEIEGSAEDFPPRVTEHVG